MSRTKEMPTVGQFRHRMGWVGTLLVVVVTTLAQPALAQTSAEPSAAAGEASAVAAVPPPVADDAVAATEPEPAAASAKKPLFSITHDMSAWGMFKGAVPVVKAVMIGLALASLMTWTIWIAKTTEFLQARRKLKSSISRLQDAEVLDGLDGIEDAAVAHMAAMTTTELGQSTDLVRNGLVDGVKERVAVRLQRLESAAARKISRGVGILATVGSTAPFVGLFGTVWGIMHSFMNIAEAQTTSLAVVAPGIAEALLATALGLVAAIPAAVMYNAFARSVTNYRAVLADCSTLIMCLLSREIDYRMLPSEKPRAVAVGR